MEDGLRPFPALAILSPGRIPHDRCAQTFQTSEVKEDDPLYDLLRESFFRGRKVEAGVRDFGHDAQSGSPKICVDRVSLVK